MTKEKPCLCGGKITIERGIYDFETDKYFLLCDECGEHGPYFETEYEAVEYLELLNRPVLQWTKESPTAKDLGKLFVFKFMDSENRWGYHVAILIGIPGKGLALLDGNEKACTLRHLVNIKAEFFGPLPE